MYAFNAVNHMFQISGMVISCSTDWNMGFAWDKGGILGDEEGLLNMQHSGKAIDWMGHSTKPHTGKYPK